MPDGRRMFSSVAAPRQRTASSIPSLPSSALTAPASPPRRWRDRGCGRRDSATCSPPGRGRARAATPSRPGWRDRPSPGRRNCRRRPAPPPGPRTVALEGRGPVVHARRLEFFEVGYIETPVAGPLARSHRSGRGARVTGLEREALSPPFAVYDLSPAPRRGSPSQPRTSAPGCKPAPSAPCR